MAVDQQFWRSLLLLFVSCCYNECQEHVEKSTVLLCRVCFVEVSLHPEDCSADLLEWGSRLADYNARPPYRK